MELWRCVLDTLRGMPHAFMPRRELRKHHPDAHNLSEQLRTCAAAARIKGPALEECARELRLALDRLRREHAPKPGQAAVAGSFEVCAWVAMYGSTALRAWGCCPALHFFGSKLEESGRAELAHGWRHVGGGITPRAGMLPTCVQGVVANFMASMDSEMAAAEAGLRAAQALYRKAAAFLNGKADKTDCRLGTCTCGATPCKAPLACCLTLIGGLH